MQFQHLIAVAGLTTILSSISEVMAEESVDFKALKSPVPYSSASVTKGKALYLRYCTECHGTNGKAQVDVIADATDLTEPEAWYSGTSEGEIFHSIRDGAGVAMPPFSFQIKEETDIWHLVNFVRSLWPADQRPALAE
ncbi:MAG: c-type cytochrome [Pseudomonadales bacterium]